MARIRTIKPDFFKNEALGELHPLDRLLFIGLWTLADRAGRLEDRPRRIKAELFPYEPAYDLEAALNNLHQAGFIQRYAVAELPYIQVVNFQKHQNPHVKEAVSIIPAQESTVQAPCKPGASTVQAVQEQLQVREQLQVGEGEGTRAEKIAVIPDAIVDELSNLIQKENASSPTRPTPPIGLAGEARASEMQGWLADKSMREAFTRGRKLPANLFEEYLDDFISELAIRTEPHQNATDLRQHFLNYAAKRHAQVSTPPNRRKPNGSPNDFGTRPAGQPQPF